MNQVLLFCIASFFLFAKSYAQETEDVILQEYQHPVIKFRKMDVEPVLDYKDDQGFSALKVNNAHVKSPYWNMEFDTYHYQLQNLFDYELKGHKTTRGIHFPNITRYYQAIVHFNHREVSVELATDSFSTITTLGSIDLKKMGWNYSEALTFCNYFLNKYVLVDHLYTHFHRTPKLTNSKEINTPYWTVVDDYILNHVVNLHRIPKNEETELDPPKDEIIRQIGDFFKWRKIVMKFIHDLSWEFIKEGKTERMFKRYLIDEIHLPNEEAKRHSKMMSLKNAQMVMLMQSADPGNTNHMNRIFDHFVAKGLIPFNQKTKYMDFFT